MMDSVEQSKKIQDFMNRVFQWSFTAGECNFLLQLLAHLVQENPEFVQKQKGAKEALNYQSIRTVVLLNEKLSAQLQEYAKEASVVMDDVKVQTERVQ